MGYEIDKIDKIEIYDQQTGEKVGELEPPITCCTEGVEVLVNNNTKLKISKDTQFTATIMPPPCPNIMMIISPGNYEGNYKTVICFYRSKYYNWFQRFMYKICFGITIKQGNEVRREFL